jgi:hypothetical protein
LEELQQEYILSIIFSHAIEREELSISKYKDYLGELKGKNKNQQLTDILNEFEKNAQEHITMLKDKMIKLNIQG